MNPEQHPEDKQLTAYANNTLPKEERRIIGKHLLFCKECRDRTPLPTVEQFLDALFNDEEI